MKTKLIILNGPPGVGKSTIATRLHEEMAMSLRIEGDEWRRAISHWWEHRQESHDLVYAIKVAAADKALSMGTTVIVDKSIFGNDGAIDALIASGKAHGAEVYELILNGTKETVQARADARGYRPGSSLTREKVVEMWEKGQALIARRPNATIVDTTTFTLEDTYQKVHSIVFGS